MKYWIGVVSKDHVLNGVKEGIMQIGHGKRAPLLRLNKDDWLIYYSPVKTFGDKEPLQTFTALGRVIDDEIYQYDMSADFHPYRRKVSYENVKDVSIRPLIDHLAFIHNKKSWGYVFRFGLVEISESDFNIIKSAMVI
jgi:hypothetical protein